MKEDSREDPSVANPNDSGWAESVDPAYNRVIYYASLRGALPQPAPKRARSSSTAEEDGRAARGAGRGRGEAAARRPPPPNFFFAVRIDDEDVVNNAKTLQQHLMDEEARLWPTTSTNPSTQSNDDAPGQKDEDQERVATSTTTASSGAGDNSKKGLGRYMIDVRSKLHVTLFVVCAPTPDLVARTQALCTAWAGDLRSRPAADISSFEMKVESVRCFNKGRGQFVLWAGIGDPAPLERLARDLHSWFVQHEPSLLQSIKWTPFTPHATLLKVRSFGRGQGGSGGRDSSPGARVLRILRPLQPVVAEPTQSLQQRPEQEQDCVEGEVIIYQGRPHQDNDSNDSNANASGGERANRGRGRGRGGQGGWQGGAGRGGGRGKRNDHEVLDEGRCFGRQVVESIELLAMQGCEAVDERGRGGYPVYGRIFLDSSRSEYLDRAWAPPQLRASRGEEVVVADQEEKEEDPAMS